MSEQPYCGRLNFWLSLSARKVGCSEQAVTRSRSRLLILGASTNYWCHSADLPNYFRIAVFATDSVVHGFSFCLHTPAFFKLSFVGAKVNIPFRRIFIISWEAIPRRHSPPILLVNMHRVRARVRCPAGIGLGPFSHCANSCLTFP